MNATTDGICKEKNTRKKFPIFYVFLCAFVDFPLFAFNAACLHQWMAKIDREREMLNEREYVMCTVNKHSTNTDTVGQTKIKLNFLLSHSLRMNRKAWRALVCGCVCVCLQLTVPFAISRHPSPGPLSLAPLRLCSGKQFISSHQLHVQRFANLSRAQLPLSVSAF